MIGTGGIIWRTSPVCVSGRVGNSRPTISTIVLNWQEEPLLNDLQQPGHRAKKMARHHRRLDERATKKPDSRFG
jgi:hypothetical protein